jgi:hypothetical protein
MACHVCSPCRSRSQPAELEGVTLPEAPKEPPPWEQAAPAEALDQAGADGADSGDGDGGDGEEAENGTPRHAYHC